MKPVCTIILAVFLFPKINFCQCPVLPDVALIESGVGTTTDFVAVTTISSGDIYDELSCPTISVSNTGSDLTTLFTTPNHIVEYYRGTILPVRFISFSLVQKGPNILAQWSAEQEHNSKSFEIQRSYNGYDWAVAGTVAAAGLDEVKDYSFLDEHVTKTKVYYRIRHIDVDSRRSSFFTDIQSIKLQGDLEPVNIFTDSRKNIRVNFYSGLNSKVTIRVSSMYGQVMIKQSVANPSNFVQLSGAQLPVGIYIVSLSGNEGLITTKKIILQ